MTQQRMVMRGGLPFSPQRPKSRGSRSGHCIEPRKQSTPPNLLRAMPSSRSTWPEQLPRFWSRPGRRKGRKPGRPDEKRSRENPHEGNWDTLKHHRKPLTPKTRGIPKTTRRSERPLQISTQIRQLPCISDPSGGVGQVVEKGHQGICDELSS